eukprot:TRINITY_DN753_c0_g1_i2.p1 TRINITY_DN753_c0_g1~~TRINITY_DN753_c0_g1_i2.p1  ORF type:complete len:234 (+),score=35.34 TRINITY_DN753_c0_g1_i2:147-848(+)
MAIQAVSRSIDIKLSAELPVSCRVPSGSFLHSFPATLTLHHLFRKDAKGFPCYSKTGAEVSVTHNWSPRVFASIGRSQERRRIRTVVSASSSGGLSAEAASAANERFKDAVKAGDLAQVRDLAAPPVDINLPSSARAGWTALHLGAFYGHPEVTSFLLQQGADTEVRSGSGNTALQLACLKGHVSIARILLEAGADLDATSDDKGTAYDYAQEWGGEEMVDFLLLWAAEAASA